MTRFSVLEHLFPVLECLFPVLERLFPVLERPFPVFLFFWEAYFVPGRDRGVCPGTFAPALVLGQRDSGTGKTFLSRDKGTTGQGIFFVPGQRDNGTSRPGLSRDVPSLGNPTSSQIKKIFDILVHTLV